MTAAAAELIEGREPPEPGDSGEPPARRGPGRRWQGLLIRPVLVAIVLVVLWLIVREQNLDSIEARTLTWPVISLQLWQHVQLTAVSAFFTIVIAVPLGIVLNRQGARWFRPVGLGLGNLGQAIPSIGLVVLLALWIGIGFTTSVIALVVYSALPVLRNTIVGLQSVDPVLVESARGMGLSRSAVLRKVELPLAVPVILAGIRTALVLTVASAPLATFIDGGGLGDGLVTGLGANRPLVSITFGIIVAALALMVDWLGLLVEEVLRPRGI